MRGGKLTQEDLAERANISVSFLSMIERGQRSAHVETLNSLARALGVTMSELFRENRARTPKGPDAIAEPLVRFVENRRLSRREVEKILDVAAAMFPLRQ